MASTNWLASEDEANRLGYLWLLVSSNIFNSNSRLKCDFLKGGEPVALVRGANAPLIRTTLLEELENEKQVLQGNRQRAAVSFHYLIFDSQLTLFT